MIINIIYIIHIINIIHISKGFEYIAEFHAINGSKI